MLLAYLFIAPAILIITFVMGSISLAVSLFGSKENFQHRLARTWARMLLRVSFVKTGVEGLEKIDLKKNYVLVANHSSFMDTPVIIANIPLQFRFFAKKGLFDIPLMGTHLRRAGHFPVVRDNPRASLKSMAEGAKAVRERGVSVLLFPEGGRSEGSLKEFKEGAAFIAIKAGVPVLPLAIVGTRAVLPMHSSQVRPGRTKVIVGDPVETAGLTMHDRHQLTAALQASIAKMLGCS